MYSTSGPELFRFCSDTDQVSVCSCFRFLQTKVLRRHLLRRLTVTHDAQEAEEEEEEQPAERPGAVHGGGGGGGDRSSWRSRGSQQVHRRFSLHPQTCSCLYGAGEPRPPNTAPFTWRRWMSAAATLRIYIIYCITYYMIYINTWSTLVTVCPSAAVKV